MAKTIFASFGVSLLAIMVVFLHSPSIMITAFGQGNVLPFEIGDVTGSEAITNNTSYNNSNTTIIEDIDECVMPPCPPGQACIQSCP